MSDEPDHAPIRRRSSLLEALERLRPLHADLSLTDVLVLLAVAEHPCVGLSDLAFLLDLTTVTASRALRGFAPPDFPEALPPALGLVEIRTSPRDNRSRTAVLTAAGRDLIARLNDVVRTGVTLVS
jgi:DNA-binding MarR family transcriptional regulator